MYVCWVLCLSAVGIAFYPASSCVRGSCGGWLLLIQLLTAWESNATVASCQVFPRTGSSGVCAQIGSQVVRSEASKGVLPILGLLGLEAHKAHALS